MTLSRSVDHLFIQTSSKCPDPKIAPMSALRFISNIRTGVDKPIPTRRAKPPPAPILVASPPAPPAPPPPGFSVTASWDQTSYYVGQTITGTITGNYKYGETVTIDITLPIVDTDGRTWSVSTNHLSITATA